MKKMYKVIASTALVCSLMFSVNVNAQWAAMGSGITSGTVSTMEGFGGNLFIGGGFFAPFSDMAIWNGSTYSGPGVSFSQPPLAMATFDSVLYIATYNGIYQRIGASTIQIAIVNDPCYALCFWNHKLYAGGWMDSVNHKYTGYLAQYDPSLSKWSGVPVGVDNWVKAMCVYNGQLAVGGYMNYSTAGDTLYGVGLWSGTKWTSLLKGIKGSGGVYAMATMAGNLYIGGQFDSASYTGGKHIYVGNVTMWNGTTWDSLSKGISGTLYALAPFNGNMLAGGFFNAVAQWNGSAWSSLGALTLTGGAEINAITVTGGELYIGGNFDHAGGIAASNVAQYTIPTGIQSVNAETTVRVYPNPSNGNFTLSTTEKGQIEIYNIIGEKIFNTTLNAGYNKVNISNQPAGVYVYRVLSQDGSFMSTGRLVIE